MIWIHLIYLKKIKIIIANFENNYFENFKKNGFKNVLVPKEDGKIKLNKNDLHISNLLKQLTN